MTDHLHGGKKGMDSEQLCRERVNSIPDWIWETDPDFVYTYSNAAVEQMLGYESEEIIGSCMLVLLNVADMQSIRAMASDAVRELSPSRSAVIHVRDKAGVAKAMQVSVTPLIDENGELAGFRGTCRDISEDAKLQAITEEILEQYRILVDNSPTGILIIQDDRIAFASPSIKSIMGYSPDEITGTDIWHYIHPDERETIRDYYHRRLAGLDVPVNYESRGIDKAGNVKYFEARVSTIQYKGTPAVLANLVDVTERKSAEDRLVESEERIRSMFDALPAGVVVHNKHGQVIMWNSAACDILGIPEDVLRGKTPFDGTWDVVHEDGSPFPGDQHPVMITMRTGEPVRGIVMGLYGHDPAKTRWILVNSQPVHDPRTGEPYEYLAVFLDITERKRAEETTKTSERRLADIINFLPDPTFVIDIQGHIIAWNRAIEELSRVKAEDALGKGNHEYTLPFYGVRRPSLIDLVIRWDSEIEKKYQNLQRTDSTWTAETFLPAVGDGGIQAWLKASPLYDADGNLVGAIESVRDVTDRKRTLEALREAEAKYRSLVEESLVGVYVIRENRFLYVNPRFAEMFGYTQDELISQVHVVDTIFEEDRETVRENIRRRMEDEVQSLHYTFRAIKKSGELMDIEVLGSRTTYDGVPAVIGSALDITERKRSEEAIKLNEARMKALLQLSQMTTAPLQELANFALSEGIKLTQSEIGYIAFANEDETALMMFEWSESARQQCQIPDKPVIYPVKDTGLWGEALRQRKPMITNDYSAPNIYKKGLPEGHVKLIRHMNIPVIDEDRVVAVTGVANKKEDYDESDVRQLTLLMDSMWRINKRRQSEEDLRESEERYRLLFDHSPDVMMTINGHLFAQANSATSRVLGYDPVEIVGMAPWEISPEYQPNGTASKEAVTAIINKLRQTRSETFEWTFLHKGGPLVDCEVSLVAYSVRDEDLIQAIIRDITERKRAEENRRRLEEQLEAQKRLFYRETILSVTEGKLEICDDPEVVNFTSRSELSLAVNNASEVAQARHTTENYFRDKA